jgi:hypothetical protein
LAWYPHWREGLRSIHRQGGVLCSQVKLAQLKKPIFDVAGENRIENSCAVCDGKAEIAVVQDFCIGEIVGKSISLLIKRNAISQVNSP